MKKIILHLGVHKTATTHIQSRLWNNRELYAKHGVGYVGLNELRGLLTSKLSDVLFNAKKVRSGFSAYEQFETLIISDENILGGTNKPLSHALYPNIENRLLRVLDVFNDVEVTVNITVRDFSNYLLSRYSESLRHFPFRKFENYYNKINIPSLSWMPVLEQIISVGVSNIRVADFPEIFKDEDFYFDTAFKLPPSLLINEASTGSSISRSKISQETYRVLSMVNNDFPKKTVKAVMKALDHSQQNTKPTTFLPFDEETLRLLERNYMNDFLAMKADSRIELYKASY